MEGAYRTNHYSWTDPLSRRPALREGQHGEERGHPDSIAATSYDVMRLLADAIGRARSTEGRRVRDALDGPGTLPGVTRSITMDADPQPHKARRRPARQGQPLPVRRLDRALELELEDELVERGVAGAGGDEHGLSPVAGAGSLASKSF